MGILPTWFLYHVLLDIIYFLFYKVGHYRLKVVRANLRNSFPEKTEEELRRIEKSFYYHLAEIMVDSIDVVSISRRQLEKRIVFEDVAQHEKGLQGGNWIAALAHYGSWEYFAAYQFHTPAQVVGVYKKLHSEAFDRFYKYTRERFGMKTVESHGILKYMVRNMGEGRQMAVGLIADQSPLYQESFWIEFLNQRTAFYPGIERMAARFGIPVYFMHVEKTARIRYRVRFERIYDGSEKLPEGEITYRYARRLEAMIKEAPQYWMWSHRRWKKRRFNQQALEYKGTDGYLSETKPAEKQTNGDH